MPVAALLGLAWQLGHLDTESLGRPSGRTHGNYWLPPTLRIAEAIVSSSVRLLGSV